MEGKRLIAVGVDPKLGTSIFRFDRDIVLETWPYDEDPTDEQWSIQTESESFSYRADGRYSLSSPDTRPNDETWNAFEGETLG